MAQTVQYPPLDKPITEIAPHKNWWDQYNPSGLVSRAWGYFFRWCQAVILVTPQVIGTVALSAQGTAISATAITTTFPERPNVRLLPGLYRVSTYARITRAATTNSSLTVSIRWVDGGVTVTQAGAAMTGNTTDTIQTNTFLVRVESATSISYLTAYASTGATSMQYAVDIRVEAIPEPVEDAA